MKESFCFQDCHARFSLNNGERSRLPSCTAEFSKGADRFRADTSRAPLKPEHEQISCTTCIRF